MIESRFYILEGENAKRKQNINNRDVNNSKIILDIVGHWMDEEVKKEKTIGQQQKLM